MSLSSAFSNALSGLTVTSRRAEIVSSNIANASTEGYSRREAVLSALTLGNGYGSGVTISGITRSVNASVVADRRLSDASVAGYTAQTETLSRVESLIGTADSETTLASQISAFEAALVTASSDPTSEVRLDAAVGKLKSVADTLNQQSEGIQALRQEADADIADQVAWLNDALSQVQQLNADITSANQSGLETVALLDQRQQIVDQISSVVPVREIARDNGQIALISSGGAVLLDGKAYELSFEAANTVTADMTVEAGGLSGLSLNGTALDLNNFRLDGGSLGAAFALRDGTLVEMQSGLDEIAADLITRFEASGVDPSLGSGAAGLLTDAGQPLDLADLPGLAGRIAVNAAVDSDQAGASWHLRDGLGAVTQTSSGDSGQIDRWIDALSAQQTLVSGGTSRTAVEHASAYAASVSSTRVASEDDLSFATARWQTLKEAELATGVDTDAELQTLLVIEQAYSANARVMQGIEDMMQTLLEI